MRAWVCHYVCVGEHILWGDAVTKRDPKAVFFIHDVTYVCLFLSFHFLSWRRCAKGLSAVSLVSCSLDVFLVLCRR